MIAHNYAQIVDVCDRVKLLQHGRITYDRAVGSTSVQELTELVASDYRQKGTSQDGPVTARGSPIRCPVAFVPRILRPDAEWRDDVNELAYPRRGLHGRVVNELGRRIVAGAWAGGGPLPNEDDLAAELDVSRTVVREAVKVLQAKGLVEVRPRTGTRVRPRRSWHLLDADVVAWQFADMERGEDMRELYEIRATIEATAARLAAERRTEEQLHDIEAHQRRIEAASADPIALRAADFDFHGAVVDAAQNSLLSHVNAMIRVALEAASAPPASEPDASEALLRSAVAIAIRDKDADASEKAMRSLVDIAWRRVADDKGEGTP